MCATRRYVMSLYDVLATGLKSSTGPENGQNRKCFKKLTFSRNMKLKITEHEVTNVLNVA